MADKDTQVSTNRMSTQAAATKHVFTYTRANASNTRLCTYSYIKNLGATSTTSITNDKRIVNASILTLDGFDFNIILGGYGPINSGIYSFSSNSATYGESEGNNAFIITSRVTTVKAHVSRKNNNYVFYCDCSTLGFGLPNSQCFLTRYNETLKNFSAECAFNVPVNSTFGDVSAY